jgi:thiol-disulfide isomerase/thioredoxin
MPVTTNDPQQAAPAPRKKKGWRSTAIDVALVLAVILGVRTWQQRDLPSGPAPAVVGTTLDGKPFALEEQRGQPVLLHFWATWCSVCAMEKGSIDSIAKGGRVVTVASESGDAAKVAAYMKAQGLSFPVVLDPEGALARRYGVRGFPTSVFVDRGGVIRFAEVGYTTEIGMRLRLWLAGLLGRAG